MSKFRNKNDIECYEAIINHKQLVRELGERLLLIARKRFDNHDDSKLDSPEFELWADNFIPENKRDPESEDYKKAFENLKEVREMHYCSNRHHPEHHGKVGVKGFHLIDLLEFFIDILASSLNQDKGNLKISIEQSRERFGFSKELEQILLNTIELMDIIKETK